MTIISTALSGMNAASLRLGNAAHNIANQSSSSTVVNGRVVKESFTPQDVVQTSLSGQGGVASSLRDRTPATVSIYVPGHPDADSQGIVKLPNVSTDRELVDAKMASYDYKANLKVLKTADNMLKNLLDIQS